MINPVSYKAISDELGCVQDDSLAMSNSLWDVFNDLAENDISSSDANKQALSTIIYNTYYIVVDNHVNVSPSMTNAVVALQKHIIDNFGPVNTYLETNYIKVSQSFANLSESVGFPIDPGNIET